MSDTIEIRKLGPGDESRLDEFLLPRADGCMFLRAHSRQGLVDEGKPQQATWTGAFATGRIAGVAAHGTNGWMLLQAGEHAGAVAEAAVQASGRPVKALVGPLSEVLATRTRLGLDDKPAEITSRQELFAVSLAKVRVPELLATGRVTCRRSVPDDKALLSAWRAAYLAEAMSSRPGPELDAKARAEIDALHGRGDLFVLHADGAPVSCATFNARLPDMVQVGGVYTPPPLRNRGYSRCVVAGQLRIARDEGAHRAVLFTENPAARASYLAIGFEVIGEFGFVFFSYA
jgi:GNAT superfamily N-acetyltransferase